MADSHLQGVPKPQVDSETTDYLCPESEIIVFARAPVLGTVKTRLQPFLTAEQALALHVAMLRHRTAQLDRDQLAPWTLYVDGNLDNESIISVCNKKDIYQQKGPDLGVKMFQACKEAIEQRKRKSVLLIGADCPVIDRDYLILALHVLSESRAILAANSSSENGGQVAEVVMGPARDGGYVLIGMSSCIEEVFTNIPWGTAKVFATTRERIRQLRLRAKYLEALWDVDEPQDLRELDLHLPGLLREAGIDLSS